MDRFVSTYTMRLDAKGRVSIPAPYRTVLAKDGAEGLYCHPSLAEPALDAGGNRLIGEIDALIDRYPPYSEEREELAAARRPSKRLRQLLTYGRHDNADRQYFVTPNGVVFVVSKNWCVITVLRLYDARRRARRIIKARRLDTGNWVQ